MQFTVNDRALILHKYSHEYRQNEQAIWKQQRILLLT